MKFVAIILFCFFGLNALSQNLIQNGGFEKMSSCPKTLGDFNPVHWHSTLYGRKTPDYFSNCGSAEDFSNPTNFIINMKPFKGNSYIGLVGYNPLNGYREYVSTQLTDTLIKDEVYTFTITLSQPELALYYISNLGVIFSPDSLDVRRLPNTLISEADINIQIAKDFLECRDSWTTYEVSYKAVGGELYLHLGCFLTDEKLLYRTYQDRMEFCKKTGYNDAYYLIDEVSLMPKVDSLLTSDEQILLLEQSVPAQTFVFEDIKFDSGDFSSQETEFEQFTELIVLLKDNPNLKVLIEGHTDDVGEANDNLILSNERALFVKSFFESQSITNIILAKGYGEEVPSKPNNSKENRRKNRRVVIKVF